MFLHYVRLSVWVNVAGLVKILNSASRSWIYEKSLCKQKQNLLSYVKMQVEAGLMKHFMVQVKSGSMGLCPKENILQAENMAPSHLYSHISTNLSTPLSFARLTRDAAYLRRTQTPATCYMRPSTVQAVMI